MYFKVSDSDFVQWSVAFVHGVLLYLLERLKAVNELSKHSELIIKS